MKHILPLLFTIFLLLFTGVAFATDYYSIKSGSATDLNIWNTDRNGKGSAPSSFNHANDNFIIQNGSTVTATLNFDCKGSLIIETGGTYITGSAGNITSIGTILTINQGGVLRLSDKTTLTSGFILIQGNLVNEGGEISFTSSAPVASSLPRQKQ